ncbi:hypothetical protein AB0P17_15460 [Streptomyces sp. NPDC088124]|uniref:hypothetical protein n=1 Tax=Streptomyces sp. NPDC088124 TaxID=3154654 RepID=UPI003438506F
MFRITRTKTQTALRAELDQAHADLAELRAVADALRSGADRAADAASRAELTAERLRDQLAATTSTSTRTEGELTVLRAQHLLDTEDRVVLRALLRTARKTQATERVHIVFRKGEVHSVHVTAEDAEDAAEREGAAGNWAAVPPGTAQHTDGPAPWCIQRFPLQRTQP